MSYLPKHFLYMPPDSYFIFPKGLEQVKKEMSTLPASRFAELSNAVVFFKESVSEQLKEQFINEYEAMQQHLDPNGFE